MFVAYAIGHGAPANTIMSMACVVVLALEIIFDGEHPDTVQSIGLALAIIGVIILSQAKLD